MNLQETIANFKNYTDKMYSLQMAVEMFNWDMETGSPKGGISAIAKYMGILSSEAFGMSISDEMNVFITELQKNENKLDDITLAMLRMCKRDFESSKKIPKEEMRKYIELIANSGEIWKKAKMENNYNMYAKTLDEIIKYKIKFIDYRGFKEHPYNTLLDDYEPGMTVEKLDIFFGKLKETIVPLLKRINNSTVKLDDSYMKQHVSKETQEKISHVLMEKIGYDLNRGMLKQSTHPFSTGFGKNDCRITTDYIENDMLASFYSVMHEAGHAIYEQNKMDEIANTILDIGVSTGIHESQSRFFENVIGRSYEFLESIYTKIMGLVGENLKDVTLQKLYESVSLTPIRIYADELTYALHVMVRYEMEKDIISGNYDINDLPKIWNEKMEEYLGIIPENDTMGILQDIHWSQGDFGYFPSYALGNAYSAQLLSYMQKDINVIECIKNDDIVTITKWLTKNIHKYGAIKTPIELIKNISGEELNVDYLIKYLEDKYTKLYNL
jgi:carboxypeptidase Taq